MSEYIFIIGDEQEIFFKLNGGRFDLECSWKMFTIGFLNKHLNKAEIWKWYYDFSNFDIKSRIKSLIVFDLDA